MRVKLSDEFEIMKVRGITIGLLYTPCLLDWLNGFSSKLLIVNGRSAIIFE